MSAVNIASHLPEMAKRQPGTLAVAFPERRDRARRVVYSQYTFSELDDASDRIARGLQSIGIERGVRTVLMVKPSLEFFALTFALFKVGAVPVLIDPGMGIGNLGQCLDEAEPAAFIGIPKAHVGRILLGWGKRSLKILVTVGRRFWSGWSLADLHKRGSSGSPVLASTGSDETAAILFTSGSTGVAKGAVYTHGNFAAQVDMLRRTYDIRPGEIDLPTFPLFALFAPALGMTAVIPDMDFTRPAQVDPAKIVEAIGHFGVTTMFGSPALINRVGRYGVDRGISLPTLKRAISAGAPVPAQVLKRFSKLLNPGIEVFTPYGATEALPVSSIGSAEVLRETGQATREGRGVCVGRVVEGMEAFLIKITDDPIDEWSDDLLMPRGEIGEIVVRGPVVTREYFGRAEATRLAKIRDPKTGGILHRMGDVGYRDEQGRLWFCGRKSQRVVTASGTLFTICCEGVFNAHPHVFRTALVGVTRDGGVEPVLCVELEKGVTRDRKDVECELLKLGAKHEHTRVIHRILFHASFPVDIRHNAKIFREKLAAWARAR